MSDDFPEGVDKREGLLEWMRDGDPSRVPVMFAGPWHLAAHYYRLKTLSDWDDLTWARAARAAVEAGTHSVSGIAMPMPFSAIDFTDKLKLEHHEEALPRGVKRTTTVLTTPAGQMREVLEQSPNVGAVHREFFVKGEEEFPMFVSFLRTALETILTNPAVRQKVYEDMRAEKEKVRDFFPTQIHVFCATVELLSSFYHDQQTAVFLLYDHREEMEELFDLHWKVVQIWLDLAAKLDVDIYNYAINGLEWLSPDIYEQYMIPQAKRINEFADSQGKLSWIHTCGKKKGLIERDVYHRMGVKVVESLSAPPTGDIDDYAWARSRLGSDITTRGGMNCELLYDADIDAIKARAHEVLDGCRGYRHMIGDTNDSWPPYKWEAVQAVIDVVRERGATFE